MSKIEIDFNRLKYNLYDILNVSSDVDATIIKKKFIKIIKTFHPDKNSELEEEIYYHIILANQVLLNKESRRLYDEFLQSTTETFNELKNSFSKTKENIDQTFPEKDKCKIMFNNKIQELNKKHGYSENIGSDSVLERFNKVKNGRSDVTIEKENIRDMGEFNKKFNYNKTEGKFKDQIVEYKGVPSELSTYVHGEHYTSLSDIDKLYIEDSVQSAKYSSLDRAFMLQPTNIPTSSKSYDDRMKEYQNETTLYKNMKPNDFSTKNFNEW